MHPDRPKWNAVALAATILAVVAACARAAPEPPPLPRPDPDPETIRAMGDRTLWQYSLAKLRQHLGAAEADDRRAAGRALVALSVGGDAEAEAAMLDVLRGADTKTRAALFSALGATPRATRTTIDLTEFVAVAVGAMSDTDPAVRRAAVDALGAVTGGSRAGEEALLRALRDHEASIRAAAVVALGRSGTRAAEPALRTLLHDSSADVVGAAAVALAELGGEVSLRALLPLLKDPRPEVRIHASAAVARAFEADAEDHLLPLVRDPSAAVRYAVARALVDAIGSDAVDPLMTLLRDRVAAVRAEAAYLLGLVGSRAQEAALRAALGDPDERVRTEAARALRRVETGVGVGGISLGRRASMARSAAYALLATGTPRERIVALATLGATGTRADLEMVRQGLWHERIVVRVAAAKAVRDIVLRFPLRGGGGDTSSGGTLEPF